MKLQIIEKESQKISGFETVYLNKDNKTLSLDHIPDNSCEIILAKNCLDNSDIPSETLLKICKKIRSGGSISISGIEMRCLFKNVINGITDEDTASHIVGSVSSMSTLDSVKNMLKSLGLSIKTSSLSGITYEIAADRTPSQ